MKASNRKQHAAQMREKIAKSQDGIGLSTDFIWSISGIQQPVAFFKSLPVILPDDSILYFEGCEISRDVRAFYEANEAEYPVAVARDCLFPVPEVFHVRFASDVLANLCEFAGERKLTDLFYHVKAYRGKDLLFHFHDAFQNILIVSDIVSEGAIAEFASRLGASFLREPYINNRGKSSEALIKAFENPGKMRIRGESWSARMWRRWTSK